MRADGAKVTATVGRNRRFSLSGYPPRKCVTPPAACDPTQAIRAATAPLTSLDIAAQVIVRRKLDPATMTVIRKRVGAALWKLRAKGMVEEVPQAGDYKGWRLA